MIKWVKFEDGQELLTLECPSCRKIINTEKDERKIKVIIKAKNGYGILQLSAIWGDNSYFIKDVIVTQGEIIEMFCPFCFKSLISENICDNCGATTTEFRISEGHIKICNRIRCKMHLKFQLTG